MNKSFIVTKITGYFIAAVWIINGLLCKVLHLVPRHEQIVARIVGEAYAPLLTKLIGIAEIVMAIWILSHVKSRLNACTQIIVIAVMNIIEVFMAPDLLFWGRANIIFAFIFVVFIYHVEFRSNKCLIVI